MARTEHYQAPRAKVYETDVDREREEIAAKAVSRALGLYCRPTKKFSFVDYVLFDSAQSVRAFLEIKCVKWTMTDGNDYKISAAKLFHCHMLGRWYSVPSYLAVNAPNGLFVVDVTPDEFGRRLSSLGYWGRTDRPDDYGQQEASASIPLRLFSLIP
jgi:hypothetical protein